MFVSDSKTLTYPNKTIIEDVLSRVGLPDKNSFTPYVGRANYLQEQFKGKFARLNITAKHISDNASSDFSANKCKPTDDGINREWDVSEITKYQTKLEEIDQSWVDKFITSMIIGFKLNNDGATSMMNSLRVAPSFYDDEDEAFVKPSDIITSEEEHSAEEKAEAAQKLCYLLKVLHEGSIEYGGSLLSFIIAKEVFFRNRTNSLAIKPSDVVRIGVYRVNALGELYSKFTIEDNTGAKFRKLFSWLKGEINDRYFKAYKDLQAVCKVLDIDLAKENPLDYGPDVIENAVCTYLVSNTEFVENYVMINPELYESLSADKLKTIVKIMDGDERKHPVTVSTICDDISAIVQRLQMDRADWKSDNVGLLITFLNLFSVNEYFVPTNLKKYDVSNGILYNLDGTPLLLETKKIPNLRFCLVSTAGYLIYPEKIESVMHVVRIADVCSYMKGELSKIGWSTLVV